MTDLYHYWKLNFALLNREVGCAIICMSKKLDLMSDDAKMHHLNAKDFAMKNGAGRLHIWLHKLTCALVYYVLIKRVTSNIKKIAFIRNDRLCVINNLVLVFYFFSFFYLPILSAILYFFLNFLDADVATKMITIIHACETKGEGIEDDCSRVLEVAKCFRVGIREIKWEPKMDVVITEVLTEI